MTEAHTEQGIKFIGEMEKLSFKPGDICVLTVDRPISMEMRKVVEEQWRKAVAPDDLRLLVLDSGRKLGVLSPDQAAA